MKIDCGPTREEYIKEQARWHPWFAWRPVRVGSHDCRWLEWIERKRTEQTCWDGGSYFTAEYRPKGAQMKWKRR